MNRAQRFMYLSPAVLLLVALASGPTGFRADLFPALLSGDAIVVGLRLPRVLLAAMVGGSLALSGVLMQAVLHNDLAEPYVLGISGGAGLGAVATLALWPGVHPGPGAAFGAAGTAALICGLEQRRAEPSRLILIGVAIGAMFASITGIILICLPSASALRSAMFWLFGGLGSPPLAHLLWPALLLLFGGVWLFRSSRRLDRLALGFDAAAVLGERPRPLMWKTIAWAVLLTATAVAYSGTIAFVGLVAPHLARRLGARRHAELWPLALAIGASMLLAADVFARTVAAPRELPVGLVCALVGGPVFLALVWKSRR